MYIDDIAFQLKKLPLYLSFNQKLFLCCLVQAVIHFNDDRKFTFLNSLSCVPSQLSKDDDVMLEFKVVLVKRSSRQEASWKIIFPSFLSNFG
jgi:hypothetical protein